MVDPTGKSNINPIPEDDPKKTEGEEKKKNPTDDKIKKASENILSIYPQSPSQGIDSLFSELNLNKYPSFQSEEGSISEGSISEGSISGRSTPISFLRGEIPTIEIMSGPDSESDSDSDSDSDSYVDTPKSKPPQTSPSSGLFISPISLSINNEEDDSSKQEAIDRVTNEKKRYPNIQDIENIQELNITGLPRFNKILEEIKSKKSSDFKLDSSSGGASGTILIKQISTKKILYIIKHPLKQGSGKPNIPNDAVLFREALFSLKNFPEFPTQEAYMGILSPDFFPEQYNYITEIEKEIPVIIIKAEPDCRSLLDELQEFHKKNSSDGLKDIDSILIKKNIQKKDLQLAFIFHYLSGNTDGSVDNVLIKDNKLIIIDSALSSSIGAETPEVSCFLNAKCLQDPLSLEDQKLFCDLTQYNSITEKLNKNGFKDNDIYNNLFVKCEILQQGINAGMSLRQIAELTTKGNSKNQDIMTLHRLFLDKHKNPNEEEFKKNITEEEFKKNITKDISSFIQFFKEKKEEYEKKNSTQDNTLYLEFKYINKKNEKGYVNDFISKVLNSYIQKYSNSR